MRKTILTFVVFSLLAACAGPPAPSDTVSTVPEATETAVSIPAAEAEPTVVVAEPQPVPTSRGDALVASDPALVNLNPGRPVLVEFFRFT
jgi:type IV pilus biogenesis protein CpaD/CtpE